jgi:hypothetical protein
MKAFNPSMIVAYWIKSKNNDKLLARVHIADSKTFLVTRDP